MQHSERCFNALGDPTRRMIFERLAARPLPVVEIARGLTVTRPAVSQHLKVLVSAGLAKRHVEGTRHYYGVDSRGVESMRDYLDQFWGGALAAFKRAAETSPREGRR